MPKQNRPVVRDGRLQPKKKRTDRSYLTPSGGAPTTVAEAPPEPAVEDAPASEAAETVVGAAPATETVADAIPAAPAAAEVVATTPAPRPPAPPVARAAAAPAAVAHPTGSARALQQQGVRKRRDVDLDELGRRDTAYAIHELRRIAILATVIIVTLIVLGFVLR